MWEDDAITNNIEPIANLLIEQVPNSFQKVEMVGSIVDGSERVSAVYIDGSGVVRGLPHFFDIAKDLRRNLSQFFQAYSLNGTPWVSLRLTVSNTGDFNVDYSYDDPYKFDRHK